MKCNISLMCRAWSTSGLLRQLQIKHNLSKATQPGSSALESAEINKRKVDSDNCTRSTSQQKSQCYYIFLNQTKKH